MAAELFGKYQLLHKLATGGMGEVWLARQSGPAGFDRFVAVKRLLPNLAENNEFVQMFLDEARLVARLTHPNICQVYEFGSEKGMYYLAMEYMHGEPLSSLLERSLKEKKPIDKGLSAFIVAQALEGLHFAHERKDEHGQPLGLVHRDISPSNIFVTYDGTVKLLDFGIAKAAHRLTHTVAGAIKGKFGYIAPEVYRGEPIDRRVDIFAMGVVLWEMLVRKRLYKRDTEYEVLRAVVEEPPPDPRKYDPSVPEELAIAALKALAKKPAERFQTGNEMRKQIAAYLRELAKEVDAEGLAALMQNLYGQVWIDLRASVLDSFKDASGDISGADVLNPTKTDSSVSQIKADFSRSLNTPRSPPGAVAPPAPPRVQKARSSLPLALGGLVVGGALAAAAVFYFQTKPEPAPQFAQPAEPAPPPKPEAVPETPQVPAAPTGPAAVVATPPKPARGELMVTVQPAAAQVRLDGRDPVIAPVTFKDLEPGKHELVFSAAGYEVKKRPVVVQAGPNSIDDVLSPLPAVRPPRKSHPSGGAPPKRGNDSIRTDEPINPWGH
ncbi:MAG: serine/threonine protein kinase [Myxococcales bacterium]